MEINDNRSKKKRISLEELNCGDVFEFLDLPGRFYVKTDSSEINRARSATNLATGNNGCYDADDYVNKLNVRLIISDDLIVGDEEDIF